MLSYICDCDKNTACDKTLCHKKHPELPMYSACCTTTDPRFAKKNDKGKIMVDYDNERFKRDMIVEYLTGPYKLKDDKLDKVIAILMDKKGE